MRGERASAKGAWCRPVELEDPNCGASDLANKYSCPILHIARKAFSMGYGVGDLHVACDGMCVDLRSGND